ncbi:hypothetical protein D3C81_972570 [compost metagenome]
MRAVTSTGIAGVSSSVNGCWLSSTSVHVGFSVTDRAAAGRASSLVLTAVTVSVLWTGPVPLVRLLLTVASCVPAASAVDSVGEVAV